jgi:hypothetical protein
MMSSPLRDFSDDLERLSSLWGEAWLAGVEQSLLWMGARPEVGPDPWLSAARSLFTRWERRAASLTERGMKHPLALRWMGECLRASLACQRATQDLVAGLVRPVDPT